MSNSDRLDKGRIRYQINLGFADSSPVLKRLLDAERLTGRSMTRIAREVVEDYLELWLSARRRELALISEARQRIEG